MSGARLMTHLIKINSETKNETGSRTIKDQYISEGDKRMLPEEERSHGNMIYGNEKREECCWRRG
jgi:hypothetical protein